MLLGILTMATFMVNSGYRYLSWLV